MWPCVLWSLRAGANARCRCEVLLQVYGSSMAVRDLECGSRCHAAHKDFLLSHTLTFMSHRECLAPGGPLRWAFSAHLNSRDYPKGTIQQWALNGAKTAAIFYWCCSNDFFKGLGLWLPLAL